MYKTFREAIRGTHDDFTLEKLSLETLNSPSSPRQELTSPPEPISTLQRIIEEELQLVPSTRNDDYRSPLAYEDGGMTCGDKKQMEKLRSVGKEMVKQIGRKLLSGELNLTKISFPIKACAPKTALKNSIDCCTVFPHYLNLAAHSRCPQERFKLTATAILSSPSYVNMFLKPLNPILGETLQAEMADGTKIYCQQISHHPPISYFLIYGPKDSYQFSGYYDFEINPGLNSLSLKNIGKRKFLFKDGTQITATYPTGVYSSTFFGTNRVEETKTCHIQDLKNGLSLTIAFDKVKKKPSDYFLSHIIQNGVPTDKVYGTYLGYIQINGTRYWDARDFPGHEIIRCENLIPSDWSNREDLRLLEEQRLEEAQKEKERLEHLQRTDDKLRKKHKKGHKE